MPQSLPEDHVEINLADLRVHPGGFGDLADDHEEALSQVTGDFANLSKVSITVPSTSPLVEGVGKPFDPGQIPGPNSWVPIDSIWAMFPYPGPPNVSGWGVKSRLESLGQLTGRPLDEIVKHAGPFSNRMGNLVTWDETSMFSGFSVTLSFDLYGVCREVIQETTI